MKTSSVSSGVSSAMPNTWLTRCQAAPSVVLYKSTDLSPSWYAAEYQAPLNDRGRQKLHWCGLASAKSVQCTPSSDCVCSETESTSESRLEFTDNRDRATRWSTPFTW